jgi:hypothetical protein
MKRTFGCTAYAAATALKVKRLSGEHSLHIPGQGHERLLAPRELIGGSTCRRAPWTDRPPRP